jgi:hypothetical protein
VATTRVEVAVRRVGKASLDHVEVDRVEVEVGRDRSPADSGDTLVANADTPADSADLLGANTAEATAPAANAGKAIVAGMAIAAVFTDTTVLRIITAAATTDRLTTGITAAAATTINGAIGSRPAPTILTTTTPTRTARQQVERAARKFGGGGTADTRIGCYPDRIRHRPQSPERYDPHPIVFFD